MPRLGVITVLVGALAALSLGAGLAGAYDWGWRGYVGNGLGNGACPLYTSQSACSPWNYFAQVNAANYVGDRVLAGLESSSLIRGKYLDGGQSRIIYASELGMGGWYTRAHTTWCNWGDCFAWQFGYADVWFRAFT